MLAGSVLFSCRGCRAMHVIKPELGVLPVCPSCDVEPRQRVLRTVPALRLEVSRRAHAPSFAWSVCHF